MKRMALLLKMLKVRAHDGTSIAITEDVVDHVIRKHFEIFVSIGLDKKGVR